MLLAPESAGAPTAISATASGAHPLLTDLIQLSDPLAFYGVLALGALVALAVFGVLAHALLRDALGWR